MAKTNPNGANQHIIDPRQNLFLELWLDPKSDTFSNALQSALKAGYSQEYSESLLARMPSWLSEKVSELNMLSKAERNLNKFLDLDKNPKIQADITKFVAERLGKKKYGKDESTQSNIINILNVNLTNKQRDAIARRFLERASTESSR